MKLMITFALLAFIGGSIVEGRVARDLKSDLIARGNALIVQADAALVKLAAEHKSAEAAIVKAEEAKVKSLIAELEVAVSHDAIVKIEAELSRAEQQLAAELAKINRVVVNPVVVDPVVHVPETHDNPATHHNPGKRDTKSNLIARGNVLIVQADAALVKLAAEHKNAEAAIVKAEEAKVKSLIAQLETALPSAFAKIEADLSAAEQVLAAELAKLSKAKRDTKSSLIARGNALIAQADAALATLHNSAEAAIVRAEEAKVKSLIAELEVTVSASAIAKIEAELSRAEQQLAAELAKINRVVVDPVVVDPIVHVPNEHVPETHNNPGTQHNPGKRDTKSSLIARGNALIAQADAALATLHNSAEAAIVRAEEAKVKSLIAELEVAVSNDAIVKIEAELSRAEQQLAAELARINRSGTVHVEPVVEPEHNPRNPGTHQGA